MRIAVTDNNDNVTDMDGWRQSKKEQSGGASSLPELLQHMRRVRDSVPVSNTLREELRRELARRRKMGGDIGAEAPVPFVLPKSRRGGRWLLPGVVGGVLILLFIVGAIWNNTGSKVLEAGESRFLSSFRADAGPLVPAFNPGGTVAVLSRSGALLLLDLTGGQFGLVNPPAGEQYLYPAWSPRGNKIALVRQKPGGKQEIIQLKLPGEYADRKLGEILQSSLTRAEIIANGKTGQVFNGLSWSPDGSALAYTINNQDGGNEIFVLEKGKEYSLGAGRHPAWSPDAAALVVQRDYNTAPVKGTAAQPGYKTMSRLWLVDRKSGKETLLGEGSLPSWGVNGYLAYVDLQLRERVLSYLPDGSPQFTVQQLTGTARTVYLGKKGSAVKSVARSGDGEGLVKGGHLLATAESSPGVSELEWMRRLEFNGVREPRTLYLDHASTFEHIGFGPDAKWVVTCRLDGDIVAMSQVFVDERLVKGVN